MVSGDALGKLLRDVSQPRHVAGTFVVSTCNRVEIYAEVDKFHGGVSAICELLARHSGIPLGELTQHLYVHYEDRAVQHLLAVACGLDSMVVGESQILGQVRRALSVAREHGTLSRGLGDLGTLALRTAKRAHAETGIDRAGANLVSVGIAAARGPAGRGRRPGPRTRRRPLAGPAGAGRRRRLDELAGGRHRGPAGRGRTSWWPTAPPTGPRGWPPRSAAAPPTSSDLHRATWPRPTWSSPAPARRGLVITAELRGRRRWRAAGQPGRPLVLLDLALPRDVDPAAAALPGVTVIGLDDAGAGPPGPARLPRPPWRTASDVAAVRADRRRGVRGPRVRRATRPGSRPPWSRCGPRPPRSWTRSWPGWPGRLHGLDAPHPRRDRHSAMRRVVDKLLHAPTVRVKELAGSPGGDSYEAALRVLFDLDPAAVAAVTRPTPSAGARLRHRWHRCA